MTSLDDEGQVLRSVRVADGRVEIEKSLEGMKAAVTAKEGPQAARLILPPGRGQGDESRLSIDLPVPPAYHLDHEQTKNHSRS